MGLLLISMHGALAFNDFILNSSHVDVPLGGYNCIWSLTSDKKISKLYRFLIYGGLFYSFPNISGIVLDRHLSDHRLILLRKTVLDYGLIPFRLLHSWFLVPGFDQVVRYAWENDGIIDDNVIIALKRKLQFIKNSLKSWYKDFQSSKASRKNELLATLAELDKKLDDRDGNPELIQSRASISKSLIDLNKMEGMELS